MLAGAKISFANVDGADRGQQYARSHFFQNLLGGIPYTFCLLPVTHSQLFVLWIWMSLNPACSKYAFSSVSL